MAKDSLSDYLVVPVAQIDEIKNRTVNVEGLKEWVWGLGHWGKGVLVQAGFAVASPALSVWQSHQDPAEWMVPLFGKPSVQAALQSIEIWLATGDEVQIENVKKAAAGLRSDLKTLELSIEEAPGSAEIVEARQNALYAALAVQYTADAVLWNADELRLASMNDREGATALAAGPAFEIVQAVDYARLALGASVFEIREIIRRAFKVAE